jgi:hypothetical protein
MNQMTQPALRSAAAQATSSVIKALLHSDAKKASVYLSEKLVVSACRRFKADRRSTREDYVLKIGTPNYRERAFLRTCRAAGQPLPVRRVQLQAWPRKRNG